MPLTKRELTQLKEAITHMRGVNTNSIRYIKRDGVLALIETYKVPPPGPPLSSPTKGDLDQFDHEEDE